ncbi:MAG: hydrolase [Blastochloris viridis]|uniref:Hydrolase n=1 Tax=Blastochloris viridis TaxID=1079 RepID=A0A6N4R9Q7_BLAVI|nr:MAG: hydrolase [Blastochloris viridis]
MRWLWVAALLAGCGGNVPQGDIVCEASCKREDGRFANPPGSPQRTAGRWEFQKFFWGGLLRDKSPTPPAGHVMPLAEAAHGWVAQTGNKMQWLGHSAFRMEIGGTTLLTDPLLTKMASPFQWAGPYRYVPSPLAPEEARADLILITHNHYDHLDIETLKRLPNKDTVVVVVPLGVGPVIKETGITQVVELDWHQSLTFRNLDITLVPAIHFSARWTDDRNKTLWGGYAIKERGVKAPVNIWLSGDTTVHPQVFKDIGSKYGPFTHGLVGIGAYEPRSIMMGSHTTPEEAAAQGVQTRSKRIVAQHWGTVVLTPEPAFEAPGRFTAAAAAEGYKPEDVWVMAVGETRALTE